MTVVNGTPGPDDVEVPRDASFGWLAEQRDIGFFNVLHVHSLELTSASLVSAVLDRCARESKQVVVTLHDVAPMFETEGGSYRAKLIDVAERGLPIVTLTQGAADRLGRDFELRRLPEIVPHGYVVPPDHASISASRRVAPGLRFAMYGGFRPNRLMYPVAVNFAFGMPSRSTLSILTRALSLVELGGGDAANVVRLAAHLPDRIRLKLRPFPTDESVIEFLAASDVLVMPYLWGTHSGQLEAAFDLGLTPVIADTGYFRHQWLQHEGLVPEPIWLDWQDGAELFLRHPATERAPRRP